MSYTPPYPPSSSANAKVKRRIIIAVMAVILIVVGLFVFRFATAPKAGGMGGGMGVPVVSQNPRPETVTGKVSAIGTLHADQSINVAPEIEGRIESIPGVEGQAVKKGDLLVQLDQAISKADLADAQANLSLATATYSRTSNLATRQFATRQSEDEALSALRQGRARVASAQARFDKTSITAPFDGVLGLRQKSAGSYVKGGDTVFTLTSVDPIYVDFRVPELKSARIQPGQKVSVDIPALGAQNIEGEVTAVDPALDEAGRSLAVRARLPNADGKLRAGMFSQVTVAYGDPHAVLVVPERAVFLKADGSYIYRAKAGKAEQAKVTLGERRVGEVEILDGLAANDDVITDGQIKLVPGAPVMMLSKPNTPEGQTAPTPMPKADNMKPVEEKPPAAEEKKPEDKPVVSPGTPPVEEPKVEAPKTDAPPAADAPKPTDAPSAFVPAGPEKSSPADEKKE